MTTSGDTTTFLNPTESLMWCASSSEFTPDCAKASNARPIFFARFTVYFVLIVFRAVQLRYASKLFVILALM